MNPLAKAYCVLRYLGPGFVARRASLSLKKCLGVTRRRFAPRPWDMILLNDILAPGVPTTPEGYAEYKVSHLPPFLFSFGKPPVIPASITNAPDDRVPNLQDRLDLLRRDHCIYFFNQPSPEPVDWYHNPFDGTRGDSRRIWSDIPDFTPEQGDPRVLWEPSRAAWAFDLARARARQLDFPCAAVYWKWVDSWMSTCPPFNGFQWKCGQESTVRFIALILGFWTIGGEGGDKPWRWLQMARLAWATGYRIVHHIAYAVSQNNNHALSEACGLILIAHLYPEFRDAAQWDRLGRKVLTEGMQRQIYADGSYIQHSMNYHRVMLHVCTLAMRVAELSQRRFPQELYHLLDRAAQLLFQMTDCASGRAPNYGNNDGACVLPLSECDVRDYRPVIQSAYYLVQRKRLVSSGPWDEEALWMHGDTVLHAPTESIKQNSSAFPNGGYYTLRTPTSWVMARGHSYRDRPGQYDPLHVDLWWKGLNVLCDRGTYRYYHPTDEAVEAAFRSVSAHNTIEIDGRSPERWLGRFLHVPFSRAELLDHKTVGYPLVWAAVSRDYSRPPWRVLHVRTVIGCDENLWVIIDDVLGEDSHQITLRWQLPNDADVPQSQGDAVTFETARGPVTLRLVADSTTALRLSVASGRIEGGRAIGFAAPHYNSLTPAPTVEATMDTNLPLRLVTAVYLGEGKERTSLSLSQGGTSAKVECGETAFTIRLEERITRPHSAFQSIVRAPA